jgi:phosphate transport system permease protein
MTVQKRIREKSIEIILLLCTLVSLVTTIGLIVVLGKESISFFESVPLSQFLFGTQWEPLLEPRSFGVLPLVSGTMMIVIGSILFALPIGLATAFFLSEYASHQTRFWLKPFLEVLAGIPTVVYGFFALMFVTPAIRYVLPQTEVFNALSAAIVVGIMILPMIVSLSDDAFRSVPRATKEGGYAMGATSFEVAWQILLPASVTRVLAAVVLALSRALGETMAVTLAAGATPKLTANPLESIQTMTAYIVQVTLGDAPAGGIEFRTIMAVGALLFVITFAMNWFAHRMVRRQRYQSGV